MNGEPPLSAPTTHGADGSTLLRAPNVLRTALLMPTTLLLPRSFLLPTTPPLPASQNQR